MRTVKQSMEDQVQEAHESALIEGQSRRDYGIKQLYIAYDLLTSYLVDRSTNPFTGFEDVDPDIDNVRTIIEEAIERLE